MSQANMSPFSWASHLFSSGLYFSTLHPVITMMILHISNYVLCDQSNMQALTTRRKEKSAYFTQVIPNLGIISKCLEG